MGDQHQRQVELVDEVGEHLQHLGLDHDVQGGGGLVGHDQPWTAGQGHRDHDALALAPGQLVRIRPGANGRKAHLFEQLADAAVHIGACGLRLVDG